jgi:F420-0:gamma-glutamyl ligase
MFPGTLPWLKAVVRAFSFTQIAAINRQFLVWECCNRCYGNDIVNALSNELAHRISVFVNVVVGSNAEHIPVHVIEAIKIV